MGVHDFLSYYTSTNMEYLPDLELLSLKSCRSHHWTSVPGEDGVGWGRPPAKRHNRSLSKQTRSVARAIGATGGPSLLLLGQLGIAAGAEFFGA